MLVVDSGALSRLSERSTRAVALLRAFRDTALWPPVVPTMVLVESLHGDPHRDANTHWFLKSCILEPNVPTSLARRAAELRRRATRGSPVDALVVALAEPHGTVLTTDHADLQALAAHATDVTIHAT